MIVLFLISVQPSVRCQTLECNNVTGECFDGLRFDNCDMKHLFENWTARLLAMLLIRFLLLLSRVRLLIQIILGPLPVQYAAIFLHSVIGFYSWKSLQTHIHSNEYMQVCLFHRSTDTDECASNPCQNGATCNDAVNQYTCACAAGYESTLCETGM